MEKVIRKMEVGIPSLPQRRRVAAYARVSSGKDAMLHSLSAQVSYYSDHIQKNPEWEYAGVYVDEALTGTKDDRDGFQRLLADCRAGKIDMVLTKSISRFARNTVTLLETVRELKMLGVDVYFEEQNIHSLSGDGELMLTILASYAQEESRSVSENCKWRIRENFKRGIPTSPQMNGLQFDHGQIRIIPHEAKVVSMIFSLRLAGMGKDGIARFLNQQGIPAKKGGIWHSSTIEKILHNEKYQGDLLLQKQFREDHLRKIDRPNQGEYPRYFIQGNHEAIVSREDFETVQKSIAQRRLASPQRTSDRKTYPFTKKLVCDQCGKHYRRRIDNGKVAWQCTTFMSRGKAYCPARQIRESILESISAEALGLTDFSAQVFEQKIKHIRICTGNRLIFHFKEGHEIERTWIAPSRRDSWTDEMREQARRRNQKCIKSEQTPPR